MVVWRTVPCADGELVLSILPGTRRRLWERGGRLNSFLGKMKNEKGCRP